MRNTDGLVGPGANANNIAAVSHAPSILKQCIVLLIATITIILTYQLGISLGMGETLHPRHTYYSIPGAIGFLNHGGSGYTVYFQLFELIASRQTDINSAISQAIQFQNLDQSNILFIPHDDKGTIDFVVGSFILFGSNIQSLYKGYFLLLIVSATVYFAQFRKRESELICLTLVLLSLLTVTRVFPITKELFSFHNPRVFGTLAIIPVMHLCFLMVRELRPTSGMLMGSLVQVFILVEVIHVRSTEIWVLFPPLMAGVMLLASNRRHIFRLWPCALLVFGFVLLNVYQYVAYNSEYFKTKGQYHIFWHNVGIGLSLHPDIAAEYQLAVDDLPMNNLVRRYAMETGGESLVNDIFGKNGIVHGMAQDLELYDKTARGVVFEIVKKHPAKILYLHLWIKPKLFVMNALWAAGLYPANYEELKIAGQIGSLTSEQDRRQRGIYFNPFNWYVFACLVLLAVVFPTAPLTAGILVVIGLLGASLISGFATYPLIHLVAIPLNLLALCVQLTALVLIRKCLSFAVVPFARPTT